jgi:antitoxin (DNA-binding transcriptional repressor) of toxin-antitoxin stability system
VTTGDYFPAMKAIGIKELKARLSEYLRAVEAGETVLVTRHDEVVAEIRPPRRAARDDVEARLASLAEAGQLTRANRPKEGWSWRVGGLGLPTGAATALLGELRGERGEE